MIADLIDQRCRVEFIGPYLDWPGQFDGLGFPLWLYVIGVNPPLIQLSVSGRTGPYSASIGTWVNMSIIKTIQAGP